MLLTWLQATPGWVLPGASLDLNFAAGTYYPAGVDSLLTVTRAQTVSSYATTSTGSLTAFAANTPRITDLGLLVEQAATNVLLQSNTFSTSWSAQGLNGAANPTLTANSGTSPDGTNNAWAFAVPVLTGTQVGRIIQASASASGSNTFTASVWLWVASGTAQITFQIDDSSNGNPAVGSAVTVTATTTPTRYTTTGTFAATPGNARFDLSTGSGSGFAGSGGYTLLMFGAQLESGSFATSYIPTTTVAVARAADKLQWGGVALPILRSATGWARAAFPLGAKTISSNVSLVSRQLSPDDAFFVPNANTSIRALANSSGAATATIGSAGTWAGRVVGAVTWDGTGVSIAANAGTVNAGATPFTASPTDAIYLGSSDGATAGTFINNFIERVTFGTGAKLTSAQVQALAQ